MLCNVKQVVTQNNSKVLNVRFNEDIQVANFSNDDLFEDTPQFGYPPLILRENAPNWKHVEKAILSPMK